MMGARAARRSRASFTVAATAAMALLTVPGGTPTQAQGSPIQHIVVLDLENHSFDSLLGFWCRTAVTLGNSPRCGPGDSMPPSVTFSNGTVVAPRTSPDVVPLVDHSVASQVAAMDGGRMDGWQNIPSKGNGDPACTKSRNWQCITGYQPSQDPNITSLASSYALEDRFFSLKDSPSWGGHMYAVAGTTDGFTGDNPTSVSGVAPGPGWGCDSNKVAARIYGPPQPACVPDFSLTGPDGSPLANGGAFEPTSVLHVPTIMDELGTAGLSWRIYGEATPSSAGEITPWGWSVCPAFADCWDTGQRAGLVDSSQFFTDAGGGNLPSFSLITAGGAGIGATDSCHNGFSMAKCDNWVGQIASAVMNSPAWPSTALLVTWDDWGGFYDGVAPPLNPDGTQEGPRLPLIAVSPYAVPQGLDSTPASFASILAFTERTFGLAPLEANDASAYDLSGMFVPGTLPGTAGRAVRHLGNKPRMVILPVPKGEHIVWSQAGQDS